MSSRARPSAFAGATSAASAAAVVAVAAVTMGGVLAWPCAARAQSWSDRDDKTGQSPELNQRTTRDGLVVGLGMGVGLAGASGYPNSSGKIDQAAYYASSDLLVGRTSTLFVMGALADYVNFGLWFGAARFASHDWSSTVSGGGFRVELFPLYVAVPSLKNLGVATQLGLGSGRLTSKTGSGEGADGVQSFLGLGGFYEWTLFKGLGGHMVLGPSLQYEALVTRSISAGSLSAGLRVAFYGGI